MKPSKHITLALAMKGLTNKKNVLQILHRYGHMVSYTKAEELETESVLALSSNSEVCPEDILRTSSLRTSLAWNNFDRFVDTKSGKDTLHDTVGIIFQDVPENFARPAKTLADFSLDPNNVNNGEESSSEVKIISSIEPPKKKMRRSFDITVPEVVNKPKRKLNISENLLGIDDPRRLSLPENLITFKNINFAWVSSINLNIPNVPMWVGFNSLIHQDRTPKQNIAYLTTINSSPTNQAVVELTLHESIKAADECGQKYVQVTIRFSNCKNCSSVASKRRSK